MDKEKAEIEINDKRYAITGTYKSTVLGFPNSEDKLYHNEFLVTIKRVLDNGETIKRSFKYYGSVVDYEKHREKQERRLSIKDPELNEKDLLFAFRSFIEDAIAGDMSFNDFCGDFGYDTDSRRAEKIHKLCQKSLKKTLDLGLFTSELQDTLEVLSNRGIE